MVPMPCHQSFAWIFTQSRRFSSIGCTWACWMSNPPAVTHPVVSGGAIGLPASTNHAAILKHLRTPPTTIPAIDYPLVDSDHISKRNRPIGITDEVNLPVNILPAAYPQNHSQASYIPDDLPKIIAWTLNQGSTPMSMNFHPTMQTLLLVGTNVGDIGLWDVGTREKPVHRNFKVWELGACSMSFQITVEDGDWDSFLQQVADLEVEKIAVDVEEIGRPVVFGLATKGEQGVRRVTEMLKNELELTMALIGCPTLRDITRNSV